jgi:uncharacterized membrane protein YvbJ
MTYCQKCGTKNDDDAEFCKKCGATLKGDKKSVEKEWDKKCDQECQQGPAGRGWGIFWGIIIILVGLWIIFEFVLKKIEDLPPALEWIHTFPFGLIIAVVVGIFVIIFGLRILGKR